MAYVKLRGKVTNVDDEEAAALIEAGAATPTDPPSSSGASQPSLRIPDTPLVGSTSDTAGSGSDDQSADSDGSTGFAGIISGTKNPDTTLDLQKKPYEPTPGNWVRAGGDVVSGAASIIAPEVAPLLRLSLARPILFSMGTQLPSAVANLGADWKEGNLSNDPYRTVISDAAPVGLAGVVGGASGAANRYLTRKLANVSDPNILYSLRRAANDPDDAAHDAEMLAQFDGLLSPDDIAALRGNRDVVHVISDDASNKIKSIAGATIGGSVGGSYGAQTRYDENGKPIPPSMLGTLGSAGLGALLGGVGTSYANKGVTRAAAGINNYALQHPERIDKAIRYMDIGSRVPAAGLDAYKAYEDWNKRN